MQGLIKVSGVIICQNEEKFISRAIGNIYNYVDEIIIMDGGSEDATVDIIKQYPDRNKKLRLVSRKFTGHFGDQKNLVSSLARGIWILNIDADELFPEIFLKNMNELILGGLRDNVEVFAFPRKNYIDGVLQEDAYPDYQLRLYRAYCRWTNMVHEQLVGWNGSNGRADLDDKYAIIHDKTSERQGRQNALYQHLMDMSPYRVGGTMNEDVKELLIEIWSKENE